VTFHPPTAGSRPVSFCSAHAFGGIAAKQAYVKFQKTLTRKQIRRRTRYLLSNISKADTTELLTFARSRLKALCVPLSSDEDVVQRAIESIMRGLVPGHGGRKPRAEDVTDHATFMTYLRGVVASKAEAEKRWDCRQPLVPYDDQRENQDIPESLAPDEEASLADYGRQLFARMRERAPTRLMETIAAFERAFPHTDRIPSVRGQRRYVVEVRHLAQEVTLEIGIY
jgi:hypothetical protein